MMLAPSLPLKRCTLVSEVYFESGYSSSENFRDRKVDRLVFKVRLN
jgi:hypothetical protein